MEKSSLPSSTFSPTRMLKLARYSEVHWKYSKERMEDILRRVESQRDDANFLDKIKIPRERVGNRGYGVSGHAAYQRKPQE